MSDPEGTSATVSMKGGGYYSQHTRGAKDVIDNTAALALGELDVEGGDGAFAIADLGAADGGTSIDLVRALVAGVRARSADRPVTVTYTDLPRNDAAITDEEYARAAFPQFYKTIEEHCRPLQDTASPVHEAGLRLVSACTRTVACPYAAAFREHADAGAFAEAYVPTLRSWSETVFFNALDPARALDERFYQSYVDLVRRDPEGHAMDYVHVYMVVARD